MAVIYINQGEGTLVTVERIWSEDGLVGLLYDGDSVSYEDELTITVEAKDGYKLDYYTNASNNTGTGTEEYYSEPFDSTGSKLRRNIKGTYSVLGNVTISTTATPVSGDGSSSDLIMAGNCTVIDSSFAAGYAYNFLDYYIGYYVSCLSFTTPEFEGVSKDIEFSLYSSSAQFQTQDGHVVLRYALCSSNANLANYSETSSVVTDEYQIISGTCEIIAGVNNTFTIQTEKLNKNTNYYLILWSCDEKGFTIGELSSVDITYINGLIYIDNGTTFESYQCYVDNGTSWDMCIPYIDNGTSWDICG